MVNSRIKKNKRGWVRLLEAFIAIVLLTSVLVVVSKTNSSPRNELQERISIIQTSIIRDIQLNEELRAAILSVNVADPVEWEDFETSGLSGVKERIEKLAPKDMECSAQICEINNPCSLKDVSKKEVYAKSGIISADLNTYSPRQIKMFCIR